MLLSGWVLARGVLVAMPGEAPATVVYANALPPILAAHSEIVAVQSKFTEAASGDTAQPPNSALLLPQVAPPPPMLGPAPIPMMSPAPPLPSGSQPPPPPAAQVAVSHQLLYLAAFAQLPLPPEVLADRPDLAALPRPSAPQSRWSGDGWLLWRQDSAALPLGGFAPASYGASQAGAVLRYRLAPGSANQPLAYLRITSALASPGQPEAALGIGARPIPRLPISVLAELRLTESGGRTRLRPALAVVGGLPRQRLPFGLGVEAYGQAGYVTGPDASGFVDGQARIDWRIVRLGSTELRGGGAVWGGAQRGAGRLDVGPSASVELKLGPTNARLSADWRFRIAGQAAPASGPAVTLSAGF